MKLACSVTFAAVFVLPTAARAELPGESVVPGEQRPAAELPAESVLPAYVSWQTGHGDSTEDSPEAIDAPLAPQEGDQPPPATLSGDEAAQAAPSRELPNERELPPGTSDDGARDTPANDALPIKGSPDGIPWLRLNRPGHTAPLRAIAFSADGERITTAGDDKSLVVWSKASVQPGAVERWMYQRTIRWQIQRGTRGRIYALAAAPDWVAMAGEGAMGGAGEILLIDPVSGELSAVLNDLDQGHRQVVAAMSFAPTAVKTLASLGLDGSLVHWSQTPAGLWRATRLSDPDRQQFGDDPALVQRLLAGRELSTVAAINDQEAIAPAYAFTQNNRIVWRLQRYNVDGRSAPLAADDQQAPHWDLVTAMSSGAAGQRLASADGGGYVYLWDLSVTPARLHRFPQAPTQVISLAFDDEGKRLALGGVVSPRTGRASIEVWDVADFARPRRLAGFESYNPVMACRLSPDGQTVAWSDGARAHVRRVTDGQQQTLAAGAAPPLKVAFPAERPFYRLGLSKSATTRQIRDGGQAAGRRGGPAIDHLFDTNLLKLDRLNRDASAKWLPENWLSKGWQVRQTAEEGGRRALWFYEGETRRARIPLVEMLDGAYRVVCWIPGREPGSRPSAAAIGTSAGEIYVFRLADQGMAPVLRRFRGHGAEVTSLAVSLDLRYLASASLDGTLGVWPLAGLTSDAELIQRWGADFQLVDGQLAAQDVRANGPAYFRGIRDGDRITELRYRAGDEDRVANTPDDMRAALAEVDWRTLMTFRYVRGRAAPQAFQIVPAWQQLVSLFVADDGEWAYWTPAGYYDASFEGHKLFGWQINRGLEMLPDFFLAAQFRRQLERPAAMSQLLRTGDLEAAFQAARLDAPANSAEALVNSYRLKPEVEILSPRDGETIRGEATLKAKLSVDAAQRLAPPKAFANGVVAGGRRLASETVEDGRRHYTYEWDLRLPSDPRLLLQVAAATENEVTGGDSVVVKHEPPPLKTPPRMFLLSVGVDGYRDTQIPKLNTAVETTENLRSLLQDRAVTLYRFNAASLLEDRATKPSWRVLTEDFAAKLVQGVSPDDLLVIFLSGHGVQGRGDAGYQFVTADARYADVIGERYGDCLSMADLSLFADIPCRKLVILNTCHGGAVQPLFHRELKSAVRALQDDLLLTLAASGGEQEAVEGRFARRLLEALGGAGDIDGDGRVSFAETVAFVERTVAADSASEEIRQSPSAGPKELLPYVAFPLAGSDAARVSVRPVALRQGRD